jgi:hypothetical protein
MAERGARAILAAGAAGATLMTLNCAAAGVRERISRVADGAFRQRYGSALEAVILTGSMARDEATIVERGGVRTVLGDAEFLLIFRDPRARPLPEELAASARSIGDALAAEGIDCRIGADSAGVGYLARMRPHIYGYELRERGRVLSGDAAILGLIPAFQPGDIPPEDAVHLLMNRTIELAVKAAQLPDRPLALPEVVIYRSAKLYLDAATSLLVFAGQYEPEYAARACRLRGMAGECAGAAWPFPLEEFARRVEAATAMKLGGILPAAGAWDFFAGSLRSAGLLFEWELRRLTGAGAAVSGRALTGAWMRRQALAARLRGWLVLVRALGAGAAFPRIAEWVPRAAQASPRLWTYAAAAEIAFRIPELLAEPDCARDEQWDAVRRRLPVWSRERHPGDSGWRMLAEDLGSNYENFLVGTRT